MRPGATDASMVDEALRALLARHRSAEVDAGYAGYAGYDEHPLEEADAWGDLRGGLPGMTPIAPGRW